MKIGIVGLGLIGGSIFKALSNIKEYDIIGVSDNVSAENVTSDFYSLIDCTIVFVCTPMSATLEILDKLDKILPSKAIVTDVCSVKSFLTNKKYNFKFIPSHPMAGTEHKGWNNSFPELFNGAKWVITPIRGEIYEEQELLESVIKQMGADIIITTPEEHDKAAALISHFPLLIAQSLCLNIKHNKLAQEIAASGFKDMTRLALSNEQMAIDMLEYNNDNILSAFELFHENFIKLLKSDYFTQTKDIKNFRKNLY